MRLTPWFPADVKPVRVGVYQTSFLRDDQGYSYWSGRCWSNEYRSAEDAMINGKGHGEQQKKWRGMASKDGK